MSVNDASRIVIDYPRLTLQIVASLTDDCRGIIYNCIMFIVLATDVIQFHIRMKKSFINKTPNLSSNSYSFDSHELQIAVNSLPSQNV